MTIADEIARIQGNINNAYSALYDKGATMPATNNSALLADTINTISTGGGGYQEVGKYMIDANGVVQLQAGDIDGRFKGITSIANNAMGSAFSSTNICGEANFCNCMNVGYNGMSSAFSRSSFSNNTPYYLTGVNFCNCTDVLYGAFQSTFKNKSFGADSEINFCNLVNCDSWSFYHTFENSIRNNATANFHNLRKIYTNTMNYTFRGCSGLTSIDFTSLENVSGDYYGNAMSYCFSECTGLTNVIFPSLTRVETLGLYYGFYGCSNLSEVSFPVLNAVGRQAFQTCFQGCPNLKTITMGTNQVEQNCLTLDMTNATRFSQNTSSLGSAFVGTGIEKAVIKVPTSTATSAGMYFIDACSNCQNLSSADIWITKTSMSQDLLGTFFNCKNLSSLSIYVNGDSVNVQNFTFMNSTNACSNLASVNISFTETGGIGYVSLYDNAFYHAFRNSGISTGLYIKMTGSISSNGNPFQQLLSGCNGATIDLLGVDVSQSGDIFANILAGTNGCEIKFLDTYTADVMDWASYAANFGGTNVQVSFESGE